MTGQAAVKLGYILLDGCADRPNPRLNFTTPLEAAWTPNLDDIARRSKLGRVITVRRGVAPESDIAVFNMLGYSFEEGYPGRGVIEAVGSGLEVADGDLALRANLASVKGSLIVDRRAGRDLTQDEARRLAEEVKRVRLKDAEFDYRATVSYRGVLVIRARGGLSGEVSNTDPAYARVGGFGAAKVISSKEGALPSTPLSDDPAAKRAAELINEFVSKSAKVLAGSEVNRERLRQGKLPANYLLLRDAGDHLPNVRSFKERHGTSGTALVELPAEVGIAKLLGMKMVRVKDMKDLKEKSRLFAQELRNDGVVYAHIKGPDEFGHDGDVVGKKKNIESIDRDFFAAVADLPRDVRVGVSCDHATPCTIKMHSADPVPLLATTGSKGDALRFTERSAKRGSLGRFKGAEVLDLLLRHG
jgi:2,3-bisphosphoglycerate-independent phosphoglycerate mutase